MQVKKFEARTMKEALEMVKKHLGPDAIILGARDNRKSFGLVGEGSVEITAAVTEEILQKKKFTESRMRPQEVEKFQNSTAKTQKQVMENFVNKYTSENKPQRPVTKTRYIEIDDQDQQQQQFQTQQSREGSDAAQARIKSAAQRAWNAMQSQNEWKEEEIDLDGMRTTRQQKQAPPAKTQLAIQVEPVDLRQSEILALKSELAGLKNAISHFQKIPQSVVNSHPGADFGLSYEFSSTFEKLIQAGLQGEIAAEILVLAQKEMPAIRFKNKALVDAWTARYILDSTLVKGDTKAAQVQIFVGPSGAGKTSSLVKLAAHEAVAAGKKVVLMTADTFKIGAVDQMRTYANILNVPFAVVRRRADWEYLSHQLNGYDQIFCDFPGMGLKAVEEISTLRSLLPPETIPADIHLVLSATAKNQDLLEAGRRYKVSNFSDVIFTGLDESAQHGTIYNFMRTLNSPLHSFGTGPRVPEDFELATRERVLDLIFKLTKMKKAQE